MSSQHEKRKALLRELVANPDKLSGSALTSRLQASGHDVSERSIRLYLQEMEQDGLIVTHGKKGRRITEKGRLELLSQGLLERVGNTAARMDKLTFGMGFDLETRTGTIISNASVVRLTDLRRNLTEFLEVFAKGFAMGKLISVVPPGETWNGLEIPQDSVGILTVCSITLNGILIKRGIPVRSHFAGILELHGGVPGRFAELIMYDGTSVDPLELFIKSGMTDYLGAIHGGNGRIGAGYREIPANSYDLVQTIADKAARIGLGAFLEIGKPERPVLNIPVGTDSCGVVVIGGLNPLSILIERGCEVGLKAMAGLAEFQQFFVWEDLPNRLNDF